MTNYAEETDNSPAGIRVYLIAAVLFLAAIYGALALSPRRVPTMPTVLDINGVSFRVSEVTSLGNKDQNLVGYTECSIRHIYILKSGPDKRETLTHEIAHAAVCADSAADFGVNNMYYNSTTSAEHQGIYRFSTIWAEIIQRNPALAAYLASRDKKD